MTELYKRIGSNFIKSPFIIEDFEEKEKRIEKLQKENEKLKAKIEKMKYCDNCRYYFISCVGYKQSIQCKECDSHSNWELAE